MLNIGSDPATAPAVAPAAVTWGLDVSDAGDAVGDVLGTYLVLFDDPLPRNLSVPSGSL